MILDVSSVESPFWFQQDNLAFVCSARAMLEVCWNDNEFSSIHNDVVPSFFVLHLHCQRTFGNQEQLVFVIVVVPHKIPLNLDQFYVHIIDLSSNFQIEKKKQQMKKEEGGKRNGVASSISDLLHTSDFCVVCHAGVAAQWQCILKNTDIIYTLGTPMG